MQQILRAVLRGQMPSGKNQIKMSAPRAGMIMRFPQASFEAWRSRSYAQLDEQRGAWDKLARPAKVTVRYFKGDLIGRDTPGIMDALCHLLEWCPIHGRNKKLKPHCPLPFVGNDALLEGWVWERPILDRENPRLELTIEPYEDAPQGARK